MNRLSRQDEGDGGLRSHAPYDSLLTVNVSAIKLIAFSHMLGPLGG